MQNHLSSFLLLYGIWSCDRITAPHSDHATIKNCKSRNGCSCYEKYKICDFNSWQLWSEYEYRYSFLFIACAFVCFSVSVLSCTITHNIRVYLRLQNNTDAHKQLFIHLKFIKYDLCRMRHVHLYADKVQSINRPTCSLSEPLQIDTFSYLIAKSNKWT